MSFHLTPPIELYGEQPFTIRHQSPLLLQGEGTRTVAHELLNYLLSRHQRVVVADGSNCFDVYSLARAARRIHRSPAEFLSAVRVSRSFTWQQYVTLLERKVASEAARFGARWVFALGPLDLFADEDVKTDAAALGTWRTAEALAGLARASLGVVVAQEERPLRDSRRSQLLDKLRSRCRETIIVRRVIDQPCTESTMARGTLARSIPVQGGR